MGRKRRISEGAQAKPVIEGGVGTVVRRVTPVPEVRSRRKTDPH